MVLFSITKLAEAEVVFSGEHFEKVFRAGRKQQVQGPKTSYSTERTSSSAAGYPRCGQQVRTPSGVRQDSI